LIELNLEKKEIRKKMIDCRKYWRELKYDQIQENMIVKIGASLRRNLKGYPLSPGLTLDQRMEIMDLVKKATETLDIDLQGTFLEFEQLTPQDKIDHQDIIFELKGDF
jgi:hypothetical protein